MDYFRFSAKEMSERVDLSRQNGLEATKRVKLCKHSSTNEIFVLGNEKTLHFLKYLDADYGFKSYPQNVDKQNFCFSFVAKARGRILETCVHFSTKFDNLFVNPIEFFVKYCYFST